MVFYDEGVGTSGSMLERMSGGLSGDGIDDNIKQLYKFIALNYCEGDEVYLFGFSRGAYTVRSLVGMVLKSGVVHRDQLEWAHEAYELYRSTATPDSDRAKDFRAAHGKVVPITCVACFDTVGALGVPTNMDIFKISKRRYEFHDVVLSPLVKNAIHMLSIEEDRTAFEPTLMKESVEGQLTQKYFWGRHSGVGGGLKREVICSAITFDFLVEEMKKRGLGLQIAKDAFVGSRDIEEVLGKRNESVFDSIMKFFAGASARKIESLDLLDESVIRRYQEVSTYRPRPLEHLHEAILAVKL